MKKLICLLTALMLVLSLIGCGKPEAPAASSGEAEPTVKAEESAEAVSEEKMAGSVIALKGRKDDQSRSAVFTYDSTQLEVWDEDYFNTSSIELVKIGDPTSILDIQCEAMTLDEIKAEIADVRNDDYKVSEYTESTFAGFPAYSCDMTRKGEFYESHFIIALPNGLHLWIDGYDGTVPLEEMLSYALVTLEEGDGTTILPSVDFTVDNDDDKLTVTFDSGEVFTLDYDQNTVNTYYDRKNTVDIAFNDEEMNDQYYVETYISDQYASFEDYLHWEQERGYLSSEVVTIQQSSINGVEIYFNVDEYGFGEYFFIPVTDTYALRGRCDYNGELEEPCSIALDVLQLVFGAEAEGTTSVSTGGKDSSETTSAAIFAYDAPTALEDALESMTYSLDGVVYRFPTPVMELLVNGWDISDAMREYSEIPANGYLDIGITRGDGAILYNVILTNPTNESINIVDGIVTYMIVAKNSNVDLRLPEGLSLDSAIEDLDAACDNSPAINGDYSNYSWWSEDTDDGIIAWYHPDIGLEYYEFTSY